MTLEAAHHVIVCGSRGYRPLHVVRAYVDTLPLHAVVIVGGARGPDQAAERRARERGMDVRLFLPDWNRYGGGAGYRRNAEMLSELQSAPVSAARTVAAFHDGKSHGTAWMIRNGRARGLDVLVWDANGEPLR